MHRAATMSARSITQPDEGPRAGLPGDTELMSRLADGDMNALAQLVRRHQRTVWALAYRVTGRWELADDVTQDTFLRVLRSAASYQASAAFSTWLYRIATNLCLDALRKRRTVAFPDDACAAGTAPGAAACDSGDSMERAERAEAVRREVAALPERQRVALVLHRFHDQTHAQIAQALECSIPAVESLLVRAYAQLRQRLEPWSD